MDCDIIGGFPYADPNCKGCGKPLTVENAWMTDGCPCNTALGVNSMNETRWRLLMVLQQRQSQQRADLLLACEAVKAALERADLGGEVLWILPPYQAPAVHETAWERLHVAIEDAQVDITSKS